MKSAYELAMERLEKASGPTRKLSDAQKARIAEIENVCAAKIAELKMAHESRLNGASTREEYDQIQAELSEKLMALEARRDKDKEVVWNAG